MYICSCKHCDDVNFFFWRLAQPYFPAGEDVKQIRLLAKPKARDQPTHLAEANRVFPREQAQQSAGHCTEPADESGTVPRPWLLPTFRKNKNLSYDSVFRPRHIKPNRVRQELQEQYTSTEMTQSQISRVASWWIMSYLPTVCSTPLLCWPIWQRSRFSFFCFFFFFADRLVK